MYFVDMPNKPDAGDDRNRYPVVITFRVSVPVANVIQSLATAHDRPPGYIVRKMVEDATRTQVPQ